MRHTRVTRYSHMTDDELLEDLYCAGMQDDLTYELAKRLEERMPRKGWLSNEPRVATKYRGNNTRK